MTPPGSITGTDKDHVKPSVLGPSASLVMGVKILWAGNTCREYYKSQLKPGVKNAAPSRC